MYKVKETSSDIFISVISICLNADMRIVEQILLLLKKKKIKVLSYLAMNKDHTAQMCIPT